MHSVKEFDYRVIGASAIGPYHVKTTTPCQDAFAFKILPYGFITIAVADGLGSAFLSDLGARDAVDAALCEVKRIIGDKFGNEVKLRDIAREAVFAARKDLERKAQKYQCRLHDLACTLIVVAMHKDNVAVAHIGDGAVVGRTKGGLKLISSPGDSEYANEVFPLTAGKMEKALRVSPEFPNIAGVMVFTDGLQRAILKKTSGTLIPFEGFCKPLFSYAQEMIDMKEAENDIKALLSSKKVCNNSEDDKTLVIAIVKKTV